MIRAALRSGVKDPFLVQNKRYVDGDMISVDGFWYTVYTDINSIERMEVRGKNQQVKPVAVDPWWIDDNGRYLQQEME
jgi:hypothetical protein